ncbi:MAG: hypothetical protein QNJ14_04225 [Woeseiaceae bacterium]|nr:hypothetical protein [Woeseiaceae bacterium]
MGDFHSVMLDDQGNEIVAVEAGVQTKQQAAELNATHGGAQFGHVKFQGEETVQRVQQGVQGADAAEYDALWARTKAYDEELQRVQHLEAAGRSIPQSTREHLTREYQDIFIGWKGFGIDIEAPQQ